MRRFQVSKEGMQQGYWKVYDTQTGQTLRVVQVKSIALEIADKLNKENLELADAEMMVAAPLMVEALEQVVKSVSCGNCRNGNYSGKSSCCMARAALAAAKGENAK